MDNLPLAKFPSLDTSVHYWYNGGKELKDILRNIVQSLGYIHVSRSLKECIPIAGTKTFNHVKQVSKPCRTPSVLTDRAAMKPL